MKERTQRTVRVWNRCECGRTLLGLGEAIRGQCASCYMKTIPTDTKQALGRLLAAAFKPTSNAEKDRLVDDALNKIKRDQGVAT